MGNGKEASSSSSKRDWSDWLWDDTRQKYFRTRKDRKGNLDIEWSAHTPRHLRNAYDEVGDVGQLTEAMGQTNLSQSPEDHAAANYTHADGYAYNEEYAEGAGGPSDAQVANYQNVPDNFEPAPYDDQQYAHGTQEGFKYEYDTEDYYEGDPSSSNYYVLPTGAQSAAYGERDQQEVVDPGSYYSKGKGHSKKGSRHRRDQANADIMDPEYRLHRSHEFWPGRIVKCWWPEGKGKTITSRTYNLDDMTYNSFRRFVIVRQDQGHSLIVPISTYGDQGCAKHGIKPEKHGIVYDALYDPMMTPGEPDLGVDPIRANMSVDTETLTASSRVNYSKIHTLEHNVPVWFLGEIHQEDFGIVEDAVWSRLGPDSKQSKKNYGKPSRDSRDKSGKSKHGHKSRK